MVDGAVAWAYTKTVFSSPFLKYVGCVQGYNKIIPPLIQAFCSTIMPLACLMEFDDGFGGTENLE
jgi:hypothetical protein